MASVRVHSLKCSSAVIGIDHLDDLVQEPTNHVFNSSVDLGCNVPFPISTIPNEPLPPLFAVAQIVLLYRRKSTRKIDVRDRFAQREWRCGFVANAPSNPLQVFIGKGGLDLIRVHFPKSC